MALVHDAVTRGALEARIRSVSADAQRRWGSMTVDQMLWHVNEGMEMTLGRVTSPPIEGGPKLPKWLLKFFVLSVPWPKGAPTYKAMMASSAHDVDHERERALRLLTEIAARPLDAAWVDSPSLGPLSGKEWSALTAKHLDHHLRQFGL